MIINDDEDIHEFLTNWTCTTYVEKGWFALMEVKRRNQQL